MPPGELSSHAAADPLAWRELFDGRTLAGWKIADEVDFSRHGEVRVAESAIHLAAGRPGTGIRYTGQPPRGNYELELQAMRTEGSDFFCGLTFPIGESYCTLIVGGWGGGVVGLSNLDGLHAEENETMRVVHFDNDRWYTIRLQVGESIRVWIDDEELIELPTTGHEFTIWSEQEPMRPLGIATWYTGAAVRAVRLRAHDGSSAR